jgi:hypothetical protein
MAKVSKNDAIAAVVARRRAGAARKEETQRFK